MLSTRYPFPIRKGDQVVIKTRLMVLSSNFEIDFVCFGKKSYRDLEQEKKFQNVQFHLIEFSYFTACVNCLMNISSNQPFQVVIFDQPQIKKYIGNLLNLNDYDYIHHLLVRSTSWVKKTRGHIRILDSIDSMQLNLAELIKKSHYFIKLIYQIEKNRIAKFEKNVKKYFDQVWTIAKKDAKFFGSQTKIIPTCINIDEFKPKNSLASNVRSIIFSGNLNYFPNVDAILFFYQIFQKLKMKHPKLKFMVAGKGWHRLLKPLLSDASVIFLGEVENMNKTLSKADIAVCPMNLASGMQNKVIEAMATGLPLVLSLKAKGDIGAHHLQHFLVARNKKEFYEHLERLVTDIDLRIKLSKNARAYIESHHSISRLSRDILDAYQIRH